MYACPCRRGLKPRGANERVASLPFAWSGIKTPSQQLLRELCPLWLYWFFCLQLHRYTRDARVRGGLRGEAALGHVATRKVRRQGRDHEPRELQRPGGPA